MCEQPLGKEGFHFVGNFFSNGGGVVVNFKPIRLNWKETFKTKNIVESSGILYIMLGILYFEGYFEVC